MNKIESVRNATIACLTKAEELYNVDLSNTTIRFDLKGRAAGIAMIKGDKLTLRFNTTMINGDGYDHIINDTVPHEVAHLVNFRDPRTGNNHNAGWASVCRQLGGTGLRTHNEEVIYAKGKTYKYVTSTGATVNVSQRMHSNIQRGGVYSARGKGKLNNQCAYELVGVSGRPVKTTTETKPTPAAKAVRKAASKPTATKKGTKAEQVRNQLRGGMHPEAVVEWAVVELGMKPALARTYVKNNINKI